MRLNNKRYPFLGSSNRNKEFTGVRNYASKEKLLEYYKILFNFEGIDIADSEHAILQFKNRFPKLSIDRFYEVLKRGLRKINKRYDLTKIDDEEFMIISWKYGFKLPLHLRPDKYNPSKKVGILPTTLDINEHLYNKYDEIEILVENSKSENFYACIRDVDKDEDPNEYHYWHHYIENGEYYRDFEIIEGD